jgi:excisionase family DNA binding protein
MANANLDKVVNSEWCDIRCAAAHVGMSVAFMRKAVREKRIPFARVGSKALRFRRRDLDRWLESGGCGGEANYEGR